MAARNRVVSAGGAGSNGTSQGAGGQAVAIMSGMAQLIGSYVQTDVTVIPNLNQPTLWVKVDYV